jgi:hypothetical protein
MFSNLDVLSERLEASLELMETLKAMYGNG